MTIRKSTEDNYLAFLKAVNQQKEPFNLLDLVAQFRVDIKFIGFLKDKKLVIVKSGNIVVATDNFVEKGVLADFLVYREDMDKRAKEKKSILEAHSKSAEVLPTNPLVQQLINKAVDESRKKIVYEAAKYAQMAVEMGKKDISGFIITLLSID